MPVWLWRIRLCCIFGWHYISRENGSFGVCSGNNAHSIELYKRSQIGFFRIEMRRSEQQKSVLTWLWQGVGKLFNFRMLIYIATITRLDIVYALHQSANIFHKTMDSHAQAMIQNQILLILILMGCLVLKILNLQC